MRAFRDLDRAACSCFSPAAELHAQLRLRTQASGFTPVAFVQDPPIARCSSSSSRTAASASCAARRCCGRTSSISPPPSSRRRAGSARSRVRAGLGAPAAASSSTSPIAPATPSSRGFAGRTSACRRSGLALRSALGRRGGPAFIAAAVRESQRRQPRVRPRRLPLHRPRRRRLRRRSRSPRAESGGAARQDAAHRRQRRRTRIRPAIRCRPTIRSSSGGRVGGAAGDLGLRPAQSVALQLRRSGARRHRRAGHRRRRAEPLRRDRLRAGRPRRPQLRLAEPRRRARQRHVAPGRLPAADRSDLRVRPSAGQSITGGYVYRGNALPASFKGRYFFADFVQGRVWSIALTVDRQLARRHASDLIEHTAELSARRHSATSARSASTPTASSTSSAYTLGRVFKIIGPPAAPATPTGLRIVR